MKIKEKMGGNRTTFDVMVEDTEKIQIFCFQSPFGSKGQSHLGGEREE